MHSEESNMTLWLTLGEMSPFEILYCFGHMTLKKVKYHSPQCYVSIAFPMTFHMFWLHSRPIILNAGKLTKISVEFSDKHSGYKAD